MLVVAGLVSREPLPFAAVIAVVFIIGTAYQPDSEVRETMRSFFGVHKITETSDGYVPRVHARHHDPWRRASARR